MASEIRANTLKNRVGLGTVSFTNTGPVVSGIVTANTIRLADDNKIQLGNDQDLEILHDPSNGIIRSINSGGNMHVESKNHIELNVNYNPSSGYKENALKAIANQGVSLFFNGAQKLQTTNTGATVTGTLVATTFDGNVTGNISGGTVSGSTGTFSGDVSITDKIVHTDDSDTQIRFHGDDKFRIELGGVTSAFSGLKSTSGTTHARWGINVPTPQAVLHIDEAYNHQGVLRVTNGNQNSAYYHQLEMSGTNNVMTLWRHYDGSSLNNTHAHGSTAHIWYIGGNEKVRINSSGLVNIGAGSSVSGLSPLLHLHKNASNSSAYLHITNNDTGITNNDGFLLGINPSGDCLVFNKDSTPIRFATAGIERARIHSDYLVTIGYNDISSLTQPSKLRVQGSYVNAVGPFGILEFKNRDNSGNAVCSIRGVRDGIQGGNYSAGLTFHTNGANPASASDGDYERLRITSDGKVGINEASNINGRLHVQHDALAENILYATRYNDQGNDKPILAITEAQMTGMTASGLVIGNHNRDTHIGAVFDSSAAVTTGSTSGLRIMSTGTLLANEDSPVDSNTAIQFRKDVSGNQARFIFRNRANNSSSRVNFQLMTLNRAANADVFSGIEKYQNGGMSIYNGENTNQYSNINFFTNGWRSLQLRNGNHSGAWCAEIDAYWGTSNGLRMEVGGPQSGTWQAIDFHTSHTGTQRGYIGVTYGGVSYNSSSDYRMKQDVVDLTSAIDRVKSLKPKRFRWKEDLTHTVDGFLAHEAQTVVPESVQGEKDGEQMQVMDNSKLVPLLTAALKESIAEIETLKTKVAALEG